MKSITEESQVLYGDLEVWKKRATHAETESRNLQKQVEDSEVKLAKLDQDIKDLQGKYKGLCSTEDGLRTDNTRLSRINDQLCIEKQDLLAINSELRVKLQDCRNQQDSGLAGDGDDLELDDYIQVAAPTEKEGEAPSPGESSDVVVPSGEEDRAQTAKKEAMLNAASGDMEEKKEELSSDKNGASLTEESAETDEVDEAVIQKRVSSSVETCRSGLENGMSDLLVQLQQERARVTEFASKNMELTAQVSGVYYYKFHLANLRTILYI